VPAVTLFALKYGYAPYVGKGLSMESQIHVMDLACAYVILLHAMEYRPSSFTLENPYFFCENGRDFSWKEVAEDVAIGLAKVGKLKGPKANTVPEGDYDMIFGRDMASVLGANSRSRAARLRDFDWEPREKGIWESFNEDGLPALLKELKARTPS
jgi:hypothetical protein